MDYHLDMGMDDLGGFTFNRSEKSNPYESRHLHTGNVDGAMRAVRAAMGLREEEETRYQPETEPVRYHPSTVHKVRGEGGGAKTVTLVSELSCREKCYMCEFYAELMIWLCSFVGMILLAISSTTHSWQHTISKTVGLWKVCIKDLVCVDLSDSLLVVMDLVLLTSVRKSLLAGIVMLSIVLVVDMLYGCCCAKQLNACGHCTSKLTSILLVQIVSVMCVVVSLALYHTKLMIPNFNLGWSCIIGWVGTGVCVFALCIRMCRRSIQCCECCEPCKKMLRGW